MSPRNKRVVLWGIVLTILAVSAAAIAQPICTTECTENIFGEMECTTICL